MFKTGGGRANLQFNINYVTLFVCMNESIRLDNLSNDSKLNLIRIAHFTAGIVLWFLFLVSFFANLLFHSFLLLFAEKCPWNIKDVLLVTKTWMRQMILIQQFFLNFLRNFFRGSFQNSDKLRKNIENFVWLLFCQDFFEQINVKLRNMEKKKNKWTFLPNSFIEHHK